MNKKEKEIALKEIVKQQKELIKKIKRIQKLPPTERNVIAINRAIRVVRYAVIFRSLSIQKEMIMAMPTYSSKKGGVKAIVAEEGNEVILPPDKLTESFDLKTKLRLNQMTERLITVIEKKH